MSRLHQSKYIVLLMLLAFALLQFEASAHHEMHIFGDDDCATCQIISQTEQLKPSTNSYSFVSMSVQLQVIHTIEEPVYTQRSSLVLSRAPPQIEI